MFRFVETNAEQIMNGLIASYERLTGRTVLPADPDRLFISWLADIIVQERAMLNYAASQNIPSLAAGESLDMLGEFLYGVKRPCAKAAKCTMRFVISAPQSAPVIIPKGTRVTDGGGGLVWETQRAVAVEIGQTEALCEVACTTEGAIGNGYTPEQINKLIDIDKVRFFERCENIDVSSGGSQAADDADYYELMRQSLEAHNTAGAKGAYEYHAKKASNEISDVCAVSYESSPGYVDIYAVMKNGEIADEGTKKLILGVCGDDKVRPLTDMVRVSDPEEKEFNVKLVYYIERSSEKPVVETAKAVEGAVGEYVRWQREKIGRDINPSRLMWLLSGTGIKRAEITEPIYTALSDGRQQTVPQIPKLGTIEITNGGYENE